MSSKSSTGSTRKRPACHGRFIGRALLLAPLLLLTGCFGGKPSSANVELRKQLQAQSEELDRMRLEREADRATIRRLQNDKGPSATLPTLPEERLQTLFTTHGIRLGRMTGFADLSREREGVDGIKVYLIPFDAASDPLKAAGRITVEAFDLTAGGRQVGKWDYPPEQTRTMWNGSGLLYEYVTPCPLEGELPEAEELTLKVTFVDELTGRSYTQQRVIKRR